MHVRDTIGGYEESEKKGKNRDGRSWMVLYIGPNGSWCLQVGNVPKYLLVS